MCKYSYDSSSAFTECLTPWKKLIVVQLLDKFPAVCFITAFIRTCQLTFSWANWIHSTSPHVISVKFILILYSYPRLGLISGFFRFSNSNFVHFSHVLVPVCATFPACVVLLNVITNCIILSIFLLLSLSLCLGSKILLGTFFSNILTSRSSRMVRDQVSHP
jgi:hypothetical protein